MGQGVLASILLSFGVYFILQMPSRACASAGTPMLDNESGQGHRRLLPLIFSLRGHGPLRSRVEPASIGELMDETPELSEMSKRQFDDYGHMRFGKRGEAEEKFDDYGHMRFGRSSTQ